MWSFLWPAVNELSPSLSSVTSVSGAQIINNPWVWKAQKRKYTAIYSKRHLKRYQTEKQHDFWFKKFTSIHDKLSLEMNKCLQTAHVPEWMTKRKTRLTKKGAKQRKRPKQLQTYNMSTNDVENIYSTNKEIGLLLVNKPQFVSWLTERKLQGNQRHSRITLHRSTHSKWEQDQPEKSSYGLDWRQKGIWYGSA